MLTGDLFVERFVLSNSGSSTEHRRQLIDACCEPKSVQRVNNNYYHNTNNVAPNFDNYLEEQIGRLTMSEVHMCPYPQRRVVQVSSSSGPICERNRRVATATTTVTISTKWLIEDANGDDELASAAPVNSTPADSAFCQTDDLTCIRNCVQRLETSGFYYGQLSWQEATKLLRETEVGTFLVRDSSDPAYLFALSVQTECGPTSIRIHYANGLFKLDAEDMLVGRMPRFDCAVKLIDYYARQSGDEVSGCRHVWLDGSGRRDRKIVIKRPLYNQVRPLQHLCRVAVNGHQLLQRIKQLNFPKTLHTYLTDYPYTK